MYFCSIFLVILVLKIASSNAGLWDQNQKLRKKLLKNYDKFALPHENENGTTTVYLTSIPHAVRLDDETQTMIVHGVTLMHWQDDRLIWDYKDYGDLTTITFSDDELWKPDLHVINNAEGSEIDHYGNVHFIVYNDGKVYWYPPTQFKTDCTMNLKFWPHDKHECFVRLGSWTAYGYQIDLEHFITFGHNSTEKEINAGYLSDVRTNWEVSKMTWKKQVIYYSAKYFYPSMTLGMVLQRRSSSFETMIVIPAVFIPCLLIFQFILPVDHQRRFSIALFCALLSFIEVLVLKMMLPKVGTNTPLIVSYYGELFVVSILSICLTAVLGRLTHSQNPLLSFPPPEILKRVLTGPLSKVLCLGFNASKVGLSGVTEDCEVLEKNTTPDYSHEWLLVAKAVDRISALVLAVLAIISLLAYVSPSV